MYEVLSPSTCFVKYVFNFFSPSTGFQCLIGVSVPQQVFSPFFKSDLQHCRYDWALKQESANFKLSHAAAKMDTTSNPFIASSNIKYKLFLSPNSSPCRSSDFRPLLLVQELK